MQTVFVTALTVLAGGLLMEYVVDGTYNDRFTRMFVNFIMKFNVEEQTAIRWYWRLIGGNKQFFIVCFVFLCGALENDKVPDTSRRWY